MENSTRECQTVTAVHYKAKFDVRPPTEQNLRRSAAAVAAAAANMKNKQLVCYVIEIALRVLTAMATLAAAVIMFFNEQKVDLLRITVTADYNFSPFFKLFLIGNTAACIYAYLSIIMIVSRSMNDIIHVLDTLAMGFLMAVGASAATVGYIGKKGNDVFLWQPACDFADTFCRNSNVSIGCCFLGVLLLLLLLINSTLINNVSRSAGRKL